MNTIILKIQVAIYTRDRASRVPTTIAIERERSRAETVFMPAMRVNKKLGADRVEIDRNRGEGGRQTLVPRSVFPESYRKIDALID